MNASRSPRGADQLVRALERAGVRHVFSLSGNHVMAVYDALVGSPIRLVHTRHEGAAVHMADAWARLTGEVGVVLVTGGPGHANAVSALYTALMAESPVVLLSGHAPLAQLGQGAFQEIDQAEMAAPVAKASWTCAGADALAADFARAVGLARSGRPGPVHLSLPSDALESPASTNAWPQDDAFAARAQPLAERDAAALRDWLAAARRPLILCGPLALDPRGRVQARALETATGVPVIGMESPRGVADPSLGDFASVLSRCDAVLLLGKRLDFTLKHGKPPLGPTVRYAQVDADAPEFDRTRRAVGPRLERQAQADFASACEALARACTQPLADGDWLAEVRSALAWRPAEWAGARSALPGRLHPVQALAPLQRLLDAHPASVLISDGGEFGQWAQAVLHAPRRLINGSAGSIGSGLPFALGARCAVGADVPVVAVIGDGTCGFHLTEIDTGVRHALPAVTLVGNDARWNAEVQIQVREYGAERALGCELLPTRYDLAAAALGGHGEWVTEAGGLPAALDRALASGRPACVNVMIEGVPAPVLKRPAPAG